MHGEEQTHIQITQSKKSKRLEIDKNRADISQYKKAQRCEQDNLGVSPKLGQSGKQILAHSTSVKIINKLQIENLGILTSTSKDAELLDFEPNVRLPGHPMDRENYDVSSVSCFEKTRPEKQSLPKLNFGEGSGKTLPLTEELAILDRNRSRDVIVVKSVDDSVGVGSVLGNSTPTQTHSQEELLAQGKKLRSYDSFHEKNLSVSTVFKDYLTGSTSKSPTCEFKTRGMTSQTYTSGKGVDEPCLALACREPDVSYLLKEHEQHSYHDPVLLGSDEIIKRLIAKSSQNLCAQKEINPLKPSDDTFIDDSHRPVIFGEKGEATFRGLEQSHRSPQTLTATKDVVPLNSFHNVETSQVSGTVHSVKGGPGSFPKFSKTIHLPLITKTTEVNLPVPSKFCNQDKNKAKSEELENSTQSEENRGGEAMKSGFLHAEKESSFEADTMCHGAISSPSDKGRAAGPNNENTLAIASTDKEVRIGNATIMLADTNMQLAAELAKSSSVDEKGLSTLRTESLGAEHLHSHDGQPDKSNFSPHRDTVLGPEPSSLWIKRLMLQAAEPIALGTKCLRTCDPSSSGKLNGPLGRVMNCSRTSPELILGKHFDKTPQQSDKTMLLSRDRDSSLMSLLRKYPDLSASRPWIYRWQRRQKGTEHAGPVPPMVMCEPESSNAADIQRKQFPSIAAMALVGKAVSNFRPCEFRKRGSLVVWNTEGFQKSAILLEMHSQACLDMKNSPYKETEVPVLFVHDRFFDNITTLVIVMAVPQHTINHAT
ncbi:hypothetical protein ACLOJK_032671 [Asimina triloba]